MITKLKKQLIIDTNSKSVLYKYSQQIIFIYKLHNIPNTLYYIL